MDYDQLLNFLEKIEHDVDILMKIYMVIGNDIMEDIQKSDNKIKYTVSERIRVVTAINLFEEINRGFIMEMDGIASSLPRDIFDFIIDQVCNESDKMYYAVKFILDKNTHFTCFTKKTVEWADKYIYSVATENISSITNTIMAIKGFDRRLTESMTKGVINPLEYTNLRKQMETISGIKLCVLEKYV